LNPLKKIFFKRIDRHGEKGEESEKDGREESGCTGLPYIH
jgi:hypothetical protein